ncbi:MAG: cell division protein ZapB [Spirochaetaceae bacterium]|jgi:chromosome segregation ATPase|nr:cell division protein ZapB [Spirochaetaceae bacterium]
MVTIEQVRQLESRVAKAIDYLNKVTNENTLLKTKLDSYQKRIDELEVLIQRFREDQGRIEEGIISALERLNQFEDDVQKTITHVDSAPPADETALNMPVIDKVADKHETEPLPANSPDATTVVDGEASELDIF